ncbi:MAG: hypothetical protein AAGA90_23015, partial [Actinomycetota bacterium]
VRNELAEVSIPKMRIVLALGRVQPGSKEAQSLPERPVDAIPPLTRKWGSGRAEWRREGDSNPRDP